MMYIAQPYTSQDPAVMEQRYQYALTAIAYVLENSDQPNTPYSPIVHFHEVAKKFSLPVDASFWLKHNFNVLSKCTVMVVLQLPGYQTSSGLAAEMAFAEHNGIEIWAVTQEQLDEYAAREST